VTLRKFSKILRLFLNIVVKVSRNKFFKKTVPEDIRHGIREVPLNFE
jgi:hypothetical protein